MCLRPALDLAVQTLHEKSCRILPNVVFQARKKDKRQGESKNDVLVRAGA